MALTVYPSTPKPAYSYVLAHEYKTVISDFDQGLEERSQRWTFPKRTFFLIYKLQEFSTTARDSIYEFYQNRLGAYEPFWYFDLQPRKWVDQYVDMGNATETTFDLPGNSSAATVYINATVTTAFSLSATSGEGGADQIIFDSPPASSAVITSDFTGYLRIKGRFKDDKLTEEITTKHLVNFSVSILEVKNT